MSFFSYIIVGLVMGTLAKAILPGRVNGGWISTLVVGVVGAIVGGFIGDMIFNRGLSGFFSLWTWVLALAGSLVVLALYGVIKGRKSSARS
ncbi:GlsB/YeaQ/YmgE family stress response membrane protein [Microlunatus speluncae]|uniref:GlsB/YeaQ/YmgE family stress response membrane protein n=1 Tax=Microlunatus speluncae TaxID=2594267 RepID=UPI0012661315|nr:GlsB/YeaQ/YmgE family stress response membrane protein [Microlunatus speluncae]